MFKIIIPLLTLAVLGACSAHVQRSSGAEYLARYEAKAAQTSQPGSKQLDADIIAAAAVEPTLAFPAKIGLARIENGRLSAIPEAEAADWRKLADEHRNLGTFVPSDPLVAYSTAHSVAGLTLDRWNPRVGELVQVIRLGAARQHLDAVLIYEVGATSSKDTTFLAIADLTIIGGAILPTRSIEAKGAARALLIDVVNGYPYGTAATEVELEELMTSWGSDAAEADLARTAAAQVVNKLIPEVERMFQMLQTPDRVAAGTT